jgi:membrane protein YdbS with pleckstrin-like domain
MRLGRKRGRDNPKRGKRGVGTNIVLLGAVIAGLSVHFSLNALWNAGTVIIIVMLSLVFAFYVWLWRYLFK